MTRVNRHAILAETSQVYDLPGAESFAAQQPLLRLLKADEVAAALVWPAGGTAAR
jgi:hypothetical protein